LASGGLSQHVPAHGGGERLCRRIAGFGDRLLFDAYSDAPNTHGLLSDEMHPVSAMQQRLRGADAAGLQLCVHAIGDRAISMTLDIFAQIEKSNGKRDRRWRIEHSQHMAAKDFARYARLGVIASVQPYHAIDDGAGRKAASARTASSELMPFEHFLKAE